MLTLPHSLASEWFNRDYYGTLKFNIRSTYTRYLGWYDGNPANLDPLPPEETSRRLVANMGGPPAVIAKAKEAFASGDYRLTAQLLNYVVFAEPDNAEATNLMADALEQLGYQQESSTWRNSYLTGAQELRSSKEIRTGRNPRAIYFGMNEQDLFDFLAVRLNCSQADGKVIKLNWTFPDRNSNYLMTVENSVLNYTKGKEAPDADVSLTLCHVDFIRLMFLGISLDQLIDSGEVKLLGSKDKLDEFLGLFDTFGGNFNIVLP
ncbi:MAG: hypothetical protein KGZ79_10395 [Dethiobacter sp.]|jgi:alkyl sulfatase BDS1-like metallo-beta-lactamase superfamily hydrolase|nr:hypothetical protein [Dethiobacter sp.]